MPFLGILEELLQAPGVEAALLLDETGEVAIEAGERHDRHRLVGAYQGIALFALRELAGRLNAGPIRCLVCRYDAAVLILRPLKDGYYLVVSIDSAVGTARALGASEHAAERLLAAL